MRVRSSCMCWHETWWWLRHIVVAVRARFHLPGLRVGATGAVDTQGSRRASHEALVALAKVEASMGAGMGVGGVVEPLGSRAGARVGE